MSKLSAHQGITPLTATVINNVNFPGMPLLQFINKLQFIKQTLTADGEHRIPATLTFSIRRVTRKSHYCHHVKDEKKKMGHINLSRVTQLVNGKVKIYKPGLSGYKIPDCLRDTHTLCKQLEGTSTSSYRSLGTLRNRLG